VDETTISSKMVVHTGLQLGKDIFPSFALTRSHQKKKCRALEESLKALSPNIISNVVVIGPGRPYLTLIVEPVDNGIALLPEVEQRKFKEQIIADQAPANATRIEYVSIHDPDRIAFVQRGRLPRTQVKGSIQRRELENVFKNELEVLYGSKNH
jgi:hypothetical protein